jgi:hypothetical protein
MNRKELINFLNSEKTFNEVLGIINHKLQEDGVGVGDYPMHYFMAGGAVANTIYYLLNKEKFEEPVINDIDLFFFNNVLGHDWDYNTPNPNLFIHTNLGAVAGIDGYGRTWVGPSGETMRMFGSERFGIVNKVSINVFKQSIQNFNETNYYKTLLTVFDLNCCMAGLDRVNGNIVYTEDFLDFLESDMIEVTNVSQPLQTSVRLKNKSLQLGTDLSNFDCEMNLIKHVLAFFSVADHFVNINIMQDFIQQIQCPEIISCYSVQSMIETIHAEMYSLLVQTYFNDDEEKYSVHAEPARHDIN